MGKTSTGFLKSNMIWKMFLIKDNNNNGSVLGSENQNLQI